MEAAPGFLNEHFIEFIPCFKQTLLSLQKLGFGQAGCRTDQTQSQFEFLAGRKFQSQKKTKKRLKYENF